MNKANGRIASLCFGQTNTACNNPVGQKSYRKLRFFYSKEPAHTLNTLLLLTKVWMHIQVKCCRYIGMAEYYAYCLVIALAFYAPGCKGVPKSMKYDLRCAETL